MRLSPLRRLVWRAVVVPAAARRAGKKRSGSTRQLLSREVGCSVLPPRRGICGTWGSLDKQQVASGGGCGGAQGSATREVIESSRKALNLLQIEHPTFKPTLSIVQPQECASFSVFLGNGASEAKLIYAMNAPKDTRWCNTLQFHANIAEQKQMLFGSVGNDVLGQETIGKIAEEIGLNVVHICLPHDYNENEIVDEITKLNLDPKIHGILLHPMKESYTSKILNAVKPEKDVNGVTDFNLARLVHGDVHECVVPPIASAVVKLLEKLASTPLDGKKVLLLGVHGPLEVSLQCLLQRKGVLTISSPWELKQLQSVVILIVIVIIAFGTATLRPVQFFNREFQYFGGFFHNRR